MGALGKPLLGEEGGRLRFTNKVLGKLSKFGPELESRPAATGFTPFFPCGGSFPPGHLGTGPELSLVLGSHTGPSSVNILF